jgi:hypothetical protein
LGLRYTSKMLLAAIDENHKGTYDFIYLPIDFKVLKIYFLIDQCYSWRLLVHMTKHNLCPTFQNKCNVGYAFINMTNPQHIIPFYQVRENYRIVIC